MNPHVVVYGRNLFAFDDAALNQKHLAEMIQSGFTTVIFWPINVDTAGNLFYNAGNPRNPKEPIVSNGTFNHATYAYLPPLVAALRSGPTLKRITFCIGTAGHGTYNAIQALLGSAAGRQTLTANFRALVATLSLDALDLDFEAIEGPDTTVAFTLLLHRQVGTGVTYHVYSQRSDVWIPCLQQVFAQNNGRQIVERFHMECYEGGAGNNPADWIKDIRNSSMPTGISNPDAFVYAGFWSLNVTTCPKCTPNPSNGILCPDDVQKSFATFKQATPGLQGGFIWNSDQIFECQSTGDCGGAPISVARYAQAVRTGLQGN